MDFLDHAQSDPSTLNDGLVGADFLDTSSPPSLDSEKSERGETCINSDTLHNSDNALSESEKDSPMNDVQKKVFNSELQNRIDVLISNERSQKLLPVTSHLNADELAFLDDFTANNGIHSRNKSIRIAVQVLQQVMGERDASS